MHRGIRWSLAAAAVLFGAVWLAGCSGLPSSPGSNANPNPEFVRVADSGGGASVGLLRGRGPASGSKDIDGSKGGSITVDRYTIVVPAGAYDGSATIAIGVPDPSVLKCDLKITPASANNFAVPVTFTVDLNGTNVTDLTQVAEVWYDEAARVWRLVPGSTVDVAKWTVSAPLSHFSTYGVVEGKAGW